MVIVGFLCWSGCDGYVGYVFGSFLLDPFVCPRFPRCNPWWAGVLVLILFQKLSSFEHIILLHLRLWLYGMEFA